MNRQEAVEYLHERHPHVIHAPEAPVDLEALHLEFFWFQGYVCDLVDERSERSVKRSFETIRRCVVDGDEDVRIAVLEHFFEPHLIFHPDLAWAQERMPPVLTTLSRKLRTWFDERRGRDAEPGEMGDGR